MVLWHLRQPEYIHVLLNPLPVYATGMGVIALAGALLLKSRAAQIVALAIVLIGTASAGPVIYYGHRAYDRVYAMSGPDAQQWLDLHEDRAEDGAWVFYLAAALAALGMAAPWKFPKTARPLGMAALLAAVAALGAGACISRAGGQVRHSEFRDGPPPHPVVHHEP